MTSSLSKVTVLLFVTTLLLCSTVPTLSIKMNTGHKDFAASSESPEIVGDNVGAAPQKATQQREAVKEDKPFVPHELEGLDWGESYDPNDQFCGKYDCYSVLGLDYETGKGEGTLSKSEISQVYRAMSRKYHPDKLIAKQKGMSKKRQKKLRSRFVYIAKAHEVLQDPSRKISYDYYHTAAEHEYDAAFGKSFSVHNAPLSSLSMVVMGIFGVLSVLSYFLRRNKYDVIKSHVVLAAVNDLSQLQGGGTESIWTRDKCVELMKVVLGKGVVDVGEKAADKGKGGKKGKKGKGATDSPKKASEKEEAAVVDKKDEALVAQMKEALKKTDIDPKKLGKKELTKKARTANS
ncbi:hypothetical protein TL16_g09861 [Triparma laevis f. inornata]|uniref:J domain-containing protein n=1 Tax=Triparma laevis f. inornata TaxID=1714386 RepID=A0A9W7BDN3_9STRA|nr:hypothetical protein TL16_g09861 [Triparma laevis f. inornata]